MVVERRTSGGREGRSGTEEEEEQQHDEEEQGACAWTCAEYPLASSSPLSSFSFSLFSLSSFSSSSSSSLSSCCILVAVLTRKIQYMTVHCQEHKKDLHNKYVSLPFVSSFIHSLPSLFTYFLFFCHPRRGLLMMVEKRRKLLQYLKRQNFARYNELLRELGIRPVKGIR